MSSSALLTQIGVNWKAVRVEKSKELEGSAGLPA